ncbi:sulfotransferase family protein [Rhodopila sp.]|uniref:sulfotransferase family protein n=1 Tax=Rhodopila sp. TaxID=2480087 RepID=UPI002B814A74|nr:sulfotransferase [Rhodopila sp.]HVZ06955.1 sulfotransferase [Rhodopila sp.]
MTIWTKALRVADRAAALLGLLDKPLQPDDLIAIARRQTRLSDFGDADFADPLRRLLASISAESSLSLVGRSATRWDTVRFLTNLLHIQADMARNPAITRTPIRKPIFITGLPRSGTTFLHRLMMADPGNRCPLVWETIFPSPASGPVSQRVSRVNRQLRAFEWLAPQFRSLHPIDATSPQECSEITAHVFRSLRFDTTYNIPAYRAWLDADVARHVPAYRFHRRFLQYLQHQEQAEHRWVLKCPEHLFALEAIRAVYPDARLIFVHRDPLKVLLSQSQLTQVLREPFNRNVDALSLGRLESTRWLDGTRRMMAAAEADDFAEPIHHIHHMDLISDPVATVEGAYRHFGMPFPAGVAAAIDRHVAARPKGGYGNNVYQFSDHGLDEQAERERFRPYMIRFGIVAEALPGKRGVARPPRPPAPAERPPQSAG